MLRRRESKRRIVVPILAGFLVWAGSGASAGPPAPSESAVVSDDAQATAVGVEILRAGGNAVDAAVATVLALAVVFPEAGNLGGGGFAVLKHGGEIAALDFRETAPAAATAKMFLDPNGEPRPGASIVGPLSTGVPGSPAGYYELHRRFGHLPWRRIVAPAERLAREGFVVSARLARSFDHGKEELARFPETSRVWLASGETPRAGERIRLPDLAATLHVYAERGAAAITRGRVAHLLAAAAREHGGILTESDIEHYRPAWREPLRFERFGWKFATMPLPSSGGVVIGETLGILEARGYARLAPGGGEREALLVEALRRAFADRFDLGDPATTRVSPAQLLDPAWIARRAGSIRLDRATPSTSVRAFPDGVIAESRETTHVSVVDRNGDLVALTTTLNDLFGCRLYVPGAGFFLNDQMDDFTTAPGRPNGYGLIQGDANAVRPGKRMLSSLAPTLAFRGGDEVAIGGRGGSQAPTAVVQSLLAMLLDGASVQEAVAAPRIHHQWLPDVVTFEAGAPTDAARAFLLARGERLVPAKYFAEVNAVRRFASGSAETGGDPRLPASGAVVPR